MTLLLFVTSKLLLWDNIQTHMPLSALISAREKVRCSDLLAFYYFSATTSISKSSMLNESFRLKAPSFAPNISILLKFKDFKSHVISDGT